MSESIVNAEKLHHGGCCDTCATWWIKWKCGNCGKKQTVDDSGELKWDDDSDIIHPCSDCGRINKIEV